MNIFTQVLALGAAALLAACATSPSGDAPPASPGIHAQVEGSPIDLAAKSRCPTASAGAATRRR
jgi:hypothetical protein